MSRVRHLKRPVAVLLLLVLLAGCQPRTPFVAISCPNGFGNWLRAPANDSGIEELLDRLAQTCREPLADLKQGLEVMHRRWRQVRDRPEVDHTLEIELWTSGREQELAAGALAYDACWYAEFQRHGRWLLSFEWTRSYCLPLLPDGRGAHVYHGRFALYLLANPSATTLPYLWPYLAGLGTLLLGFLALAWRRELGLALSLGRWHWAVTLFCGFALVQDVANDPILLVLFYLLACFPQWYERRLQARSPPPRARME